MAKRSRSQKSGMDEWGFGPEPEGFVEIFSPKPSYSDSLAREEEEQFAEDGEEYTKPVLDDFRESIKQNILSQLGTQSAGVSDEASARSTFQWVILGIVIAWLTAILVLVVLSGLGIIQLTDRVLLALIICAGVNIIGLLGTVVAYLFSYRGNALTWETILRLLDNETES